MTAWLCPQDAVLELLNRVIREQEATNHKVEALIAAVNSGKPIVTSGGVGSGSGVSSGDIEQIVKRVGDELNNRLTAIQYRTPLPSWRT